MTPTARSRALAREAVEYLFVNGAGSKAERLVLTSKDGRDLGGWGKPAVLDRIALAIDAARREAAQVAQRFETQIDCPNECGNFIADQILSPPASEPEEGK